MGCMLVTLDPADIISILRGQLHRSISQWPNDLRDRFDQSLADSVNLFVELQNEYIRRNT